MTLDCNCLADILAGEGMVRVGKAWKRATPCPISSYGAQDTTYGLQASPCRACAVGLISDPLVNNQGWTNTSACYNRAGWGWTQGSAQPCQNGSYAAAKSMSACQDCGANRFTGAFQASRTDCLVQPGYGLVDVSQALVSSIAASQLTSAQAAEAEVVLCPRSHYGAGGSVSSICAPCPGGKTAAAPGATDASECTGKYKD